MSSRVKALAAINVLGWLVAVPIMLVAVVDPFMDVGDWPDRLLGGREGAVQMRTATREPAPAVTRPARERETAEDPLRSTREAIARLRPAIGLAAAGGAPLGSFGPLGGGNEVRDGGSPDAVLRGRTGPLRIPTSPVQPLAPLPVPGAAPVVPVPTGGTAPARPPVVAPVGPQPGPTQPGRETVTLPAPERPIAAAPPGAADGPGPGPMLNPASEPITTPGSTSTPDPTSSPDPTPPRTPASTPDPGRDPGPRTPRPPRTPARPRRHPGPRRDPDPAATPDPATTPDPTATPDPATTPQPTATPEPSATPEPPVAPAPPEPQAPVPPADKPDNPPPPPDPDPDIPPAVKPPQDQMPAPEIPGPPGPPPAARLDAMAVDFGRGRPGRPDPFAYSGFCLAGELGSG